MARQKPAGKDFVDVLGVKMAYLDRGKGRPVLFLHGNLTSSFLWRNVIEALQDQVRCVAPDLIGMGDSAKVGHGPRSYRFIDHRTYLDAFIEILELGEGLILVGHEWGATLGFDWAMRHPASPSGFVYMETLVGPLEYHQIPEPEQTIIRAIRGEDGEDLVLHKNVPLEKLLPFSTDNPLGQEAIAEYLRPFREVGESRRALLSWYRELPVGGSPATVVELAERIADYMETAHQPKLFVNGAPGRFLVGHQRETCRRWFNQTEVRVPGKHLLPEESGPAIGRVIGEWLDHIS